MPSILQWYEEHGRKSLPWRHTTDPYHVYVSEIMLQQTQVASVKHTFYPAFLTTFPTLDILAEAPLDHVLKAWQGLGYYRRAKYMHNCAKQTSPVLPDRIDDLLQLPGIGRYTAGAIRCFGHRKRAVMVDTNIRRVIARLAAAASPTEAELYATADILTPQEDFYNFYQAMLDIGATICTPKKPLCMLCPLRSHCKGTDSPELYPEPKVKKNIPIRYSHALIYRDASERIAVIKRQTDFLGGYYTLPFTDNPPDSEPIATVQQVYSHFKSHVTIYDADDDGTYSHSDATTLYVNVDEAESLPYSAIDKKMLRYAFRR